MSNCLCVHRCTCQHWKLCMLRSADLHTTVTEERWTDPLNKMSPRNTTMINHKLQIISTCMSKAKPSPTVWLNAFTLADSLPTTSTTPWPLLSAMTLTPLTPPNPGNIAEKKKLISDTEYHLDIISINASLGQLYLGPNGSGQFISPYLMEWSPKN